MLPAMSANRVLVGNSDVGGFGKACQSAPDGSDANADVARLREQASSRSFIHQFERRMAGKISEDLPGHVPACTRFGNSQLTDNRCDSLS
jgi:hypothetical protein